MSNENNQAGGGIGFAGLLTVAFIVLKLTEVITWSWFWVLSPLLFLISLIILIALIVGAVALFATR